MDFTEREKDLLSIGMSDFLRVSFNKRFAIETRRTELALMISQNGKEKESGWMLQLLSYDIDKLLKFEKEIEDIIWKIEKEKNK
jgi:hypothetical protein